MYLFCTNDGRIQTCLSMTRVYRLCHMSIDIFMGNNRLFRYAIHTDLNKPNRQG